jgi:predicted nucleotidyltransferase
MEEAVSDTRGQIVGILVAAALAGAIAGGVAGGIYVANRKSRPMPRHAAVAPLALKEIAQQAGIQPPTALAHLNRLQDEGKVGRVDRPEGPRYAVLPFIRCEWTDPDHGIQTTWQSSLPMDWRFPLVSRIPDRAAQEFLLEWLDRAQARGFLPAPRSRFEPQEPKPPALQVVVYGSCARGDAHAKSDVDVLLHGALPKRAADRLVGLAHEVGLASGRTPDVRVLDADGWASAAPAFREAVQRDGKTVFTNLPDAPLLESQVAKAAHG